jgi:acyl transferase domain-containing protein
MDLCNNYIEIVALTAENKKQLDEKLRAAANQTEDNNAVRQMAEVSRSEFFEKAPYRCLIAGENSKDIAEKLEMAKVWISQSDPEKAPPPENVFFGTGGPAGRLAFLFPGQGSQYTYMGRSLISHFAEAGPVIKDAETAFDRNPSLFSIIYPPKAENKNTTEAAQKALQQTDVAQPAIGLISRLCHKILERHNVRPQAAAGHSFGELTALCASGCLSQKDFFTLAAARGRFMAMAGKSAGDPGQMMAVRAMAGQIEDLIEKHGQDVILANRNSPKQQVLSGPSAAIASMQEICKKNRILAKPLPVAAAFHSRLVKDAALPLSQIIASITFNDPQIPVYSNTTALPYPRDPDKARSLLGQHLLNPVDFIQTIENMYSNGVKVFLEVGPGAVLSGLVRQILGTRLHTAFSVNASAGRKTAILDMALALCRLAALGYPVKLSCWSPHPMDDQRPEPDCLDSSTGLPQ